MKTKLLFLSFLISAGATVFAAEPASCCAAKTSAKDACCARADAASAAATDSVPVSDRSIYQLGGVWTNDASRQVSLTELRGHPVVIAMFFASCEYACPIIVGDMQRIREALPPEIRAETQFVLVSFDHVRDTPAALKAYRERAAIDPASWTLLRGEPADVQELAMVLGVKYKQDARGQFSHSNLITVLNAEGEIVHQRNGLHGEVAGAVSAVRLASK